MRTNNMEIGVLRILTAYKAEAGMGAAAADAWAEDHLDEGVARVRAVLARPRDRNDRDAPDPMDVAFDDLKAWATS